MAVVRRLLESRHVYTQNEWLEACISFVKEDNEERQLTSTQLNELVYEQWLMAEIQESSLPRLPEGLGNTDICKLEGYFNLQINSILNVGESAYSQIQKMKGQDDPEDLNWKRNPSEPKIKSSRMLLLELTDGTQTVFGMEYQLIPALKVSTPPGTKIQVSGNIPCRLGALLLTASNVRVLGGSVQMLEENSYWNVLHQAIGQDPPEQPGMIKTESIDNEELTLNSVNTENSTAGDFINNNQRPLVKTETRPTNSSSVKPTSNDQRNNTRNISECGGRSIIKQKGQNESRTVNGTVSANCRSNIKVEDVSNQDFFDDDDDIIAAIADEDYFGVDEDFDMEQIDQLELGLQSANNTVTAKRKPNASTRNVQNVDVEMLCDGDAIFEDDFVSTELLGEDEEYMEVKPLQHRIGMLHQSEKARITTLESSSYVRNSSSSDSSYHRVEANRSSLQSNDVYSVKTETNYPICRDLMNTETLSSTKAKGIITKPSEVSKKTSPFQVKSNIDSTIISDTVPHESHPFHMFDDESKHFEVQALEYNAPPFEYLSNVLKRCPVKEQLIVRVKAYIATIVSRSRPMSPNWNVTVKLNDGTDTVDADLSDKVLSELMEFPVDEYRREMQEAIQTRNTALCQKVQKRTELFQRNLASTSCLMDLQFSPDKPQARILHLTQPTSLDVSEMIRHVGALL